VTARAALAILKTPPELTISDWADANRRLSSEASAEPGQWRTSRAEYQRGIMDAISDGSVESVVIMSAAQCDKTESLLYGRTWTGNAGRSAIGSA
jgi:phage terminase large subunit GpA-like protein